MSEESLPQYPDDNFQDTQMEDLESRLNNLINDEQHSQTINQIVMKQPSNGVILPLISLHKPNPQTINELQNKAEITYSQVSNNVGHSNEKSLISTSSQFFQSNTDMYHESGEISRDEADKDVLSRMTEAVFDETSTINKDMITRHNKMQKLLAKRQQRVQKLAKIVDKQIESLSDNESSTLTATAVNHSNLLASDDEFSQDEDDHFINSDGEITKDSKRKEHNIHDNNRRAHLPNFTQKGKFAKEKRSTIKEKKAITFEKVTAAQNDEPLGLVEDSNKGLSALRLRISNTSDNKKAKSVKKSHSGPIKPSHVEKTKINKNSVSDSQCTNLCFGAEKEQSDVTKYNASQFIGTSPRTQQVAYLSDPLTAQAQTHSVSTLNPTINTLQALPTEANRLLLLEPKNIKDIVDALHSTPEPSQTQILKRDFKDPGQTQSGIKNNGGIKKDHCLKPSFVGEDEIPKSKKDEEVSKLYNETIDICENNKSIPSRDAYEQRAENTTSAEDTEDHEKYSKIYQSIQNSRLLEELVENEKELLLLEEMSKIEINKTKGKDKKALLDIAARTQELSIKYTRCEPILYSKLEVSKDSLLDEFSFSNGQFFPVKQKANKDVNTFTDTGSSQIDEAYQCNEFDIIDNDNSTDASEVVDLELEDEKKVSKNKILVSGKQFDKYFDSLKQEVTEAGNIELSDSDPDSGDVMDDGVLPNASSVLNKNRMFELKVKLAKKRKQKQLYQQKRNSLNTADIDVIKKEKNLNKQQIASLMMERHRRQIREQCSSDKKDNDDFGDFDIENEYEYGTDGNEDAEELTVRKLMQNEMVYNMRKADRLRTMKEKKSAKSDIVEDEDYEYEIGSDEENDEDDETDLDEANEGEDKEIILDIKNEIDGEPEISTQVKFNANNEEEHRTDYNDDEEDVVVGKVSKKKNVVLYDSDSEDADNSSTSVKYDNSGFLKTSAINNYIEQKDDDDDDDDCLSFNGGGLTQKIKKMFGNSGDDNKGNLTQLFEKSQEASSPQTQRITSTTSTIKAGIMNDNSLSPTATAEDDNEYTFDDDSIIKGQHNESFVVGFDFDACRKEEEDRENETCIGVTDGVSKNFKASNRVLNGFTSKEKSTRKKGKLIRKTKTEGAQEEENEEDQFGGMTEDEIEKLRLQQNREMFLYEKNEEIKLRKKELKMKQKLGDVLDKEAEESDDEWVDLHGDEDNDDGDIVTNEDLQMIDNLTKNNDQLDGEKFRKLYADEELARDQGILEKLQRDLESGQLGRRKTNRNYMEINDEGEDYLEDLQRREYLWRRRERQRKRLLEQQNVDGLSKNKKAKAFFASIAEETDTFSFRESIAKQYLSDLYAVDGKEDAEIQVPGEGEKQLATEKNQMEIDQVDSESRKKRKIIIDDHYIKKTLSFIDEDNERVLKKEFKKDVMTEMFANNEDEDDDEFMKLQATSVFMKGLHQNRTIIKSRSGKPKKDVEQFIELF